MGILTTVDWVLLACLLASTVIGAWRGLVFEVLSVFVWLFAFLAGQWWAPMMVTRFATTPAQLQSPFYYGVAYVLVFVAAAFAAGLVVQLIKRSTDAIGLRPVDRALGTVFGFLRGVVVLLGLTVAMNLTPLGGLVGWKESVGAMWLGTLLVNLKPLMPQAFATYLG
jgi:membrane protein required for colicin V production